MAANSQGITVQFDGNDIGEVVSLAVDGVAADYVEVTPRTSTNRRKEFWPSDVDYGTISITCRSPGLSVDNVGLPTTSDAQLSIDQGNSLFNFDASLQSLAWVASVGELQEYRLVFKIGAQ